MGLRECPDCKKAVSDVAPACIHCGHPFQEGEALPVLDDLIEPPRVTKARPSNRRDQGSQPRNQHPDRGLVACRTCRLLVARTAKTCPHCGVPNPAPRSLFLVYLIAISVILAFVAILPEIQEQHRADAEEQSRHHCEGGVLGFGECERRPVAPYLYTIHSPNRDYSSEHWYCEYHADQLRSAGADLTRWYSRTRK